MPIGGAVLSISFLVLLKRLASPVISNLGKLHGVGDELERLQRTLKRVGALLHDAEQGKAEGELSSLWLRELKDLALDADDLMDEFEYEDLRRKVEENSREGSSKSAGKEKMGTDRCSSSSSGGGTHTVPFLREMSRRIDDIWRRLDEISDQYRDLDMRDTLDVAEDQSEFMGRVRETSSPLADPDVFGRAEVKSKVMQLLLGNPNDMAVRSTSPSVLSIVGMGGLGKTTLARWVYSSTEIQECFNLRMWVWVSYDFNLARVTRQILVHVAGPVSGLQDMDDVDELRGILVERLRGKRFLLVLDDVWEEDPAKWREFSAPLTRGGEGSKVLITTRHAVVADAAQSVKIELEGLSTDDCWLILEKHAFPLGDSHEHPGLVSLGQEIAKKVKGVPLAARTIGGLLRFESKESEWREVLQSELWEMEQDEGGIIPALKVSYEYLPPHLKRCFAYCSVFPKGSRFDVLDLVQLWMAQGYVRPQERRPVEDVGRDCLNELFSRSLIQLVDDKYLIHDVLHELGQSILQHDYCKIRGDEMQKIPEDDHFRRHLLLCYEKSTMGELEVSYEFKRLHTFVLRLSLSTTKVQFHIPSNLCDTMTCLRVLDLSSCGIETLPDSISCLRHLRFLALREAPIRCLPESLCSLYKLQTLLLRDCGQLKMLPRGMSNLVSLHYLEAKPELVSNIVGIGKLTCLQNLQVFSISEENGNKIADLRNMNELRGKLCIQNLQRVETREEAVEAALKNKQHLEILEMEWADGRDVDKLDIHREESIIEGLQQPPDLNELIIKCYGGMKFPSWMKNSSISSLEFIHLHSCTSWNNLPMSLTKLTLQDVKLNALPGSLHHLPLQQLVISQIPGLRELPLLPDTLKELTINCVGLEVLPEFNQGSGLSATASAGCDEDEGIKYSAEPSLSILKIHGCPHLTTLHEGLLQHHLRHLQVLSIKDCEELVMWPEGEGFVATLSSLQKELSIESCPKLMALPDGNKISTSLKKLAIKDCPEVLTESLFSQLHDLNSDDVHVEKLYSNLACCSSEMLRNIKDVNCLAIKLIPTSAVTMPLVLALYDRQQTLWSWDLKDEYLSRRVMLVIMEPVVDGNDAAAAMDDDSSKLLSMCLGGHPWTPSLRTLNLDSIPDKAFLGIQHMQHQRKRREGDGEELLHHPLLFPSLDRLWIWRCKDMRRLPRETMLCHMTALKELTISDCPELTLSSLKEGIQSIPSLEALHIYECPQLPMPPSSPLNNNCNEGALSGSPPLPLPPPRTLVRFLYIDDARLLQLLVNNTHHGQVTSNINCFRDHFLTSLRFLRIDGSKFTPFMREEEEGLRAIATSLQSLALFNCPNLQNLPEDLSGLLPNLKALWIDSCPEVRSLPSRGLPASLQLLRINRCPMLTERCRPPVPSMRGAEGDDWHKVAHVPVIAVDKAFVRGSYIKLLGLEAKWYF